MKGILIIGSVAGGVLLARRFARGRSGIDFEKVMKWMPEESPRKWMFRNIAATRDNTERILQLLEKEPAHSLAEPERAAA